MAWYPGAKKMELQPESDQQPAIKPTQFILHSIVAPWTPQRTYEYWRDSTNLESHFGLGYDGSLGQFIGTQTRADANGPANRRPDGTGAVSLESASNLQASDPWTAAQVEAIVRLGVWLHQTHGIPLRICRSADDPGYGYHRLHTAWNPDAHSCPGDARVKQFHEVVFPAIVARATGKATDSKELDMDEDKVFDAVWEQDKAPAPSTSSTAKSNPTWKPISFLREMYDLLTGMKKDIDALRAEVATLKKGA
ncbi:N-acetylmuramoyl-L-alanine amidase [Streptomyces sp. NBC_01171]|uniref:peptidoglycan recognition protein family protein n=1 Tax=Streptomyces sp. NBC_01171 TaxID=2903757 RepID=UPI00386BFF3A|nr:N-acetylmuramoyl-L-alanine amidase [Streptomyces sp. NBC_01171]